MRLDPLRELELVTRSKAGDRDAFAQLIEGYRRPLFSLLYSRLRHYDEARDLLHHVFVRGFLGIERLQDPTRVGSWFYGIGLNLLREKKRFVPRPADLESIPEPAAPEPIVSGTRAERLAAAIQELPDELREVLLLHHGEQLGYEEISRILGIPWNTVQGRLARGRERLRQRLGILKGDA